MAIASGVVGSGVEDGVGAVVVGVVGAGAGDPTAQPPSSTASRAVQAFLMTSPYETRSAIVAT